MRADGDQRPCNSTAKELIPTSPSRQPTPVTYPPTSLISQNIQAVINPYPYALPLWPYSHYAQPAPHLMLHSLSRLPHDTLDQRLQPLHRQQCDGQQRELHRATGLQGTADLITEVCVLQLQGRGGGGGGTTSNVSSTGPQASRAPLISLQRCASSNCRGG